MPIPKKRSKFVKQKKSAMHKGVKDGTHRRVSIDLEIDKELKELRIQAAQSDFKNVKRYIEHLCREQAKKKVKTKK